MPETAATAKVDATRGYGAEVKLSGADYGEAFREAERFAAETGAVLVHAFDDRDVIAGQGTIGLELALQVPRLDAVVVPVGGGGLIAGIAVALRARSPGVRIIGAQPAVASTLAPSLEEERRLSRPPSLTLADGLATAGVGKRPWEIVRKAVDRAVTVSEGEIAAAVLFLIERAKMIVEGAAATAVAACQGPLREELRGKRVAVVLSGGNIDVNLLDRIINLGLAEQGRVHRFATILPDRPGALSRLAAVLGSLGANIQTIRHDRGRIGIGVLETLVTVDLETRGRGHVAEIVARVRAEGFRIVETDES
jgi:threonine dehydratase